MKRYELTEALNNYLESNWTETDIAWDGLRYNVSPDTAYIKPFLRMSDSEQLEIGGGNTSALDSEDGVYMIQIFSPVLHGIMRSQITGEKLRELFRRQSPVNNVTVGNTSYKERGIDQEDERFYFSILVVNVHNFICS